MFAKGIHSMMNSPNSQTFCLRTDWPRVLIISSSAISSECATGALKAKLFRGMQKNKLMQLYCGPEPTQAMANFIKITKRSKYTDVLRETLQFNPDVIYFRANEGPKHLNDIAYPLVEELNAPVVIHIMDDWMTRMKNNCPHYYDLIHPQLVNVISHASVNISICKKMSTALERRYNRSFTDIANFAEKPNYLSSDLPNEAFTIRYCGGLAEDMNLQSLTDFVKVVDNIVLQGQVVVFEIFTMPWFKNAARNLASSNSIRVFDLVSEDDYERLLATADLLLITYNFDKKSVDYTQYSMANKLPECIMSGTPLIVYGSEDVATVSYCKNNNLATVIADRSLGKLHKTVSALIIDNHYALEVAKNARNYFLREHGIDKIHTKFHTLLNDAAKPRRKREYIDISADIEETDPLESRHTALSERTKHKGSIKTGLTYYLKRFPALDRTVRWLYHKFM